MRKGIIYAIILTVSTLPLTSFGKNEKGAGNHLVLRLFGTATAYPMQVPDGDGGLMDANCFDVELMNLKNQQVIGTATDCLTVTSGMGDPVDLTGTTYFNLPQGTLVTQGLTSVRPAREETDTEVGQITHITGAASLSNAIIDGDGKFSGATGTARLSGMVNLSRLDSDGEITFDCIFVINLF